MATTTAEEPRLDLRTTSPLMRKSARIFLSSLPAFLIVTLLLLSFRSAVHSGSLHLTSLIDGDSTLRRLFSRLSSPSSDDPFRRHLTPSADPFRHHRHRHRHRRSPFLHLSRVGTLDDDFFSDPASDDPDHRLQSPYNASSVSLDVELPFLKLRSSDVLFSYDDGEAEEVGDDHDRDVQFRIFGHGFGISHREADALVFTVSLLLGVQMSAILGFMVTYSFALGVIFFVASNSILGNHPSMIQILHVGAKSGFRRLSILAYLVWAVRDAMVQFLCIWYFSSVIDKPFFFNMFLRLKTMPYFGILGSLPPWVYGVTGFAFMWDAVDVVIGLVLAFICWVSMMEEGTRTGVEVSRDGIYFLSLVFDQAIKIKCLETIICGTIGRWFFTWVGGLWFAVCIQSLAEVYFMVVWLVLFFAARFRDGELEGRRFGRRELEKCVDDLRRGGW
ncbi:hypothetical protein QJS10_CPB18g02080 [Acorus calamus]|uniref:Transmembrane protein n=1 Tax=Acorus calamus TaxID=4465 RepID=A0AAV9CR09_ACOCL|nr:hypothetical protein QJS10_CPB18g02080 [Acorus calamus]